MIMTKQTHDEHERINSQSFDKIVNKTMFEQGYAKCKADVDEVIANWQDIEVINGSCINCIKRLSTQISKLESK